MVTYAADGMFGGTPLTERMTLDEFKAKFPNAHSIGRNTLGEYDSYKYCYAAPDAEGPGCHFLLVEVPYSDVPKSDPRWGGR
jgi:hypothetical protein